MKVSSLQPQNIPQFFHDKLISIRQIIEKMGDTVAIKNIKTDIDDLLEAVKLLSEVVQEVRVLSGAVASLRKENAKFQQSKDIQQLEHLQQERDKLKQERQELDLNLRTLHDKNLELEKQIGTLEGDKARLSKNNDELHQQLQSSRQTTSIPIPTEKGSETSKLPLSKTDIKITKPKENESTKEITKIDETTFISLIEEDGTVSSTMVIPLKDSKKSTETGEANKKNMDLKKFFQERKPKE